MEADRQNGATEVNKGPFCNLNTYEVLAWTVIFIGFAVLLIYVGVLRNDGHLAGSLKIDTSGQVGSFLGGTVGALWALGGVFFFYSALRVQKQEVKLLRDSNYDQRQELALQREEMIMTRSVFEQQAFESTFFNLVELLQKMISKEIKGYGEKSYKSVSIYTRENLWMAPCTILDNIQNSYGELDHAKIKEFNDDRYQYFNLLNCDGIVLFKYFDKIARLIADILFLIDSFGGEKQIYQAVLSDTTDDTSRVCFLYYCYLRPEMFEVSIKNYFFMGLTKKMLLSESHSDCFLAMAKDCGFSSLEFDL